MKTFFLALVLIMPIFLNAQTISASHLKASVAFLETSGIKESFDEIISNAVSGQAKYIPEDKREKFIAVMKEFMAKYFNYEILKPTLAKIYAEEFTEAELYEITKFYATPIGKKMAKKMSALQQKGAEVGMKAIQEHQEELQQMMADAFQ